MNWPKASLIKTWVSWDTKVHIQYQYKASLQVQDPNKECIKDGMADDQIEKDLGKMEYTCSWGRGLVVGPCTCIGCEPWCTSLPKTLSKWPSANQFLIHSLLGPWACSGFLDLYFI